MATTSASSGYGGYGGYGGPAPAPSGMPAAVPAATPATPATPPPPATPATPAAPATPAISAAATPATPAIPGTATAPVAPGAPAVPVASAPATSAAAAAAAPSTSGTPASSPATSSSTAYYEATLSPANNSGANGLALIAQHDGTLNVTVDATGLVPNQMHPMHIHGFPNGQPSAAPTPANDTDHDGYINTSEAQAVAGPVLLSLTTNPQVAAQSLGSQPGDVFPTADANGNLAYHETFDFNGSSQAQSVFNSLQPLGIRLVEIHGMTVPPGAVAGTSGESAGGYQASIPAAGGLLHPISAAEGQVLTHLLSGLPLVHVTIG